MKLWCDRLCDTKTIFFSQAKSDRTRRMASHTRTHKHTRARVIAKERKKWNGKENMLDELVWRVKLCFIFFCSRFKIGAKDDEERQRRRDDVYLLSQCLWQYAPIRVCLNNNVKLMSRLFLHCIERRALAFQDTMYPNDRVRHLNSVHIPSSTLMASSCKRILGANDKKETNKSWSWVESWKWKRQQRIC